MTRERPAFSHGSIHARPERRGKAALAAAPIDGTFIYGAYGQHTRTEGKPPATDTDEGCGQLFQGMAFDPALKLEHLGTRAPSPTLKRWIDQEPLAYVDGLDVYTAEADNPMHALSPLPPEGDVGTC